MSISELDELVKYINLHKNDKIKMRWHRTPIEKEQEINNDRLASLVRFIEAASRNRKVNVDTVLRRVFGKELYNEMLVAGIIKPTKGVYE